MFESLEPNASFVTGGSCWMKMQKIDVAGGRGIGIQKTGRPVLVSVYWCIGFLMEVDEP